MDGGGKGHDIGNDECYEAKVRLSVTVLTEGSGLAPALRDDTAHPAFRIHWLGRAFHTTAVGHDGWQVVRDEAALAAHAATLAASGGGDSQPTPPGRKGGAGGTGTSGSTKSGGGGGGGGKGATAGAGSGGMPSSSPPPTTAGVSTPAAPRLVRYSVEMDVTGNGQLAQQLHVDPMCHVIMGLYPHGRTGAGAGVDGTPSSPASAATPAPASTAGKKVAPGASGSGGGGGGANGAVIAPSSPPAPPLPYAAWVPVDTSPLLAGASAVAVSMGNVDAAADSVGDATTCAMRQMGVAGGGGDSLTPAAPAVAHAVTAHGLLCMLSGQPVDGTPSRREAGVGELWGGATTTTLPASPTNLPFLHLCVEVVSAARWNKRDGTSRGGTGASAGDGSVSPTGAGSGAGGSRPPPTSGATPATSGKPSAAGGKARAGSAAPPPANPPSPTAVASGPVTTPIHPPILFSPAMLRRINPLTCVLRCVDGMPGVTLPADSDASLTRYTRPTPYALLQHTCRPVYGVVRFPHDQASGVGTDTRDPSSSYILSVQPDGRCVIPDAAIHAMGEGLSRGMEVGAPMPPRPRIAVTWGCSHGHTVAWQHTTVFAAGWYPPHHLSHALQTRPLVVEVHDRDVTLWEAVQERGPSVDLPGVTTNDTLTLAARTVSSLSLAHRLAAVMPTTTPPSPACATTTVTPVPCSTTPPGGGGGPSKAGGKGSAAGGAGSRSGGGSTSPRASSPAAAPAPSHPVGVGAAACVTSSTAAVAPPAPCPLDAVTWLQRLLVAGSPHPWPFLTLPASRVQLYCDMVLNPATATPLACPFNFAHQHAATSSIPVPPPTTSSPPPPSSPSPGRPTSGRMKADTTPPTASSSKALPIAGAVATGGGAGGGALSPAALGHGWMVVDRLFLADTLLRLDAARERHAHGIATFAMGGLLSRTGQAMARLSHLCKGSPASHPHGPAASDPTVAIEPPVRVHLDAPVVPVRRTLRPMTPEPIWAMPRMHALAMEVGDYTATGARAKVSLCLAFPDALHAPTPDGRVPSGGSVMRTGGILPASPAPPAAAFNRLVLRFGYEEEELLASVLACMERVNMTAVPTAASCRSHVWSAGEVAGVEGGAMDVITGFQFVTPTHRLFVLEGVAGGAGVAALCSVLPIQRHPGPDGFLLLHNPSLPFPARLYTPYGMAPRTMKLRCPVEEVVSHPATYDAQVVPPPLLHALTALHTLPTLPTLAKAKAADAFPTCQGLDAMVRGYGDAVTLADLYGRSHPATRAAATAAVELGGRVATAEQHLAATRDPHALFIALAEAHGAALHAERTAAAAEEARATAALARADMKGATYNVPYMDAARQLQQQRRDTDFVARNVEAVRQGRGATSPGDPGRREVVWISVDGPASVGRGVETEGKATAPSPKGAWRTARGFHVPLRSGGVGGPSITPARAEELSHPWMDPHDIAAVAAADARRAAVLPGAAPFDVYPDPSPLPQALFGYVDGAGHAVSHAQFFKSVHLPPGGIEQEAAARKHAARDEWRSKVVVDDVVWHGDTSQDATKVGRLASMLHGPPRKPGLVAVHAATLPSGKAVPLEPPPLSIFSPRGDGHAHTLPPT